MFVKPAVIDRRKHPSLFHDLPAEQQGEARLKVRDPVTRQLLPDEGKEVPDIRFWHRRLRDGDVELVVTP